MPGSMYKLCAEGAKRCVCACDNPLMYVSSSYTTARTTLDIERCPKAQDADEEAMENAFAAEQNAFVAMGAEEYYRETMALSDNYRHRQGRS
eukprot:40032-Eustigmatos_ZCMA.PRE.1